MISTTRTAITANSAYRCWRGLTTRPGFGTRDVSPAADARMASGELRYAARRGMPETGCALTGAPDTGLYTAVGAGCPCGGAVPSIMLVASEPANGRPYSRPAGRICVGAAAGGGGGA